ncbi:squalene monooxygenase [Dactylosporangium sp. AC04546]|uniref:NAD(P)/FAD-dependent oxidoreductase n=1 Tax=Dactylosporangium sp. AC04546 TaxID=2862460 RepID=UPI002E7C15C9|nr:FAD-dependent monooxygenase [Dactylosporangium sp. AC04546]WVK89599.1 squalene monooxygenase [Dactylosporangium sp. AC04546]
MSGLLAARVLSESFDKVTVFDRDTLPEGAAQRRGVPQGEHSHGLLARGRQVLEELYPGFGADLAARGALPVDLQNDCVWVYGERAVPRVPSGLAGMCMSRPLIEAYVRERTTALANVTVLDGHEATRLLFDGRRVTGVTIRAVGGAPHDVPADLVVDATGRGNRGPTWLAALGFERPAEERIDPLTTYVSRDYRRVPGDADFTAFVCGARTTRPYGGVGIAADGDRWMVTLFGVGMVPPTDPDSYAGFAARLPDPRLYELLREAEPLGPPMKLRLPPSVRRRYERMTRLPERLVAIGDAICSFNPAYGQGMTVAAAEAAELRAALAAGLDGLPARFYARAAKVVDTPWDIAVGADLGFPEVVGVRTGKTRFLNGYVARVQTASERSAAVAGRFLRVANLVAPPQALFAPPILARVLWHSRGGTAPAHTAAPVPAPVA